MQGVSKRSIASSSLAFLALLLIACQPHDSEKDESVNMLSQENVLFRFSLNDSTEAIFDGQRSGSDWSLFNGEETIALSAINDTLWRVPVFNGSWVLTSDDDPLLYSGFWVDSTRSKGAPIYRIPLEVTAPATPLVASSDKPAFISGTWDVWFGESPETQPDAQLDIDQRSDGLHGTMRTPTGDYRYLKGGMTGDSLQLQTFDGAHLYVFTAQHDGGSWLNGRFFSGNHYQTTWTGAPATPTEDADPMITLKVPDSQLYTRLIRRDGSEDTLSLLSKNNELIVLDVLGTWCPNCMDEVRLLTTLNHPGARFISLAFERDTSASAAYRNLDRFAQEMGINWELYWGGKANKKVAANAFPFLEQVVSFPTTIFIQGNDVTVHSGFNGPATGKRYALETQRFQDQLNGFTSLGNH